MGQSQLASTAMASSNATDYDSCLTGSPSDGPRHKQPANSSYFHIIDGKTQVVDEKVRLGSSESSAPRPPKRAKHWHRFKKIARLLMTGYATEQAQRKYEATENWPHFHATLMRKLENIGIVSGLLLAANTNLLISGDLRRMTYTAVMASICGSLLSIVFGLLCLWSLCGVHPTRLKLLVQNSSLFYYLHATPSLFGGASALCFFVAVGAWTWLDQSTAGYGWGGKLVAVILSAALLGNAGCCFILGASAWEDMPQFQDPQSPAPTAFSTTPGSAVPFMAPPPTALPGTKRQAQRASTMISPGSLSLEETVWKSMGRENSGMHSPGLRKMTV